jgi:ATP-dependent Clp protease ATP-binding subunit ClpC
VLERFTKPARRAVLAALEEATARNDSFIGTEHILLAIIREDDGGAVEVLESLGISADAIRQLLLDIIGPGNPGTSPGHIPFTPRAKEVFELASDEAAQHTGTAHILLGLIREGEGVAAQVLERLGADLQTVREQVVQAQLEPGDPDQG